MHYAITRNHAFQIDYISLHLLSRPYLQMYQFTLNYNWLKVYFSNILQTLAPSWSKS